jgi:hypothetical protein
MNIGLMTGIQVECYAGSRGDERPVRFRLADQMLDIDEILDRWLAPDHRYFKVRAKGDIYILRNDVTSGGWELTMFQRAST